MTRARRSIDQQQQLTTKMQLFPITRAALALGTGGDANGLDQHIAQMR
jgi:hypothetical protein